MDFVSANLAQLVRTMHNICKVWGSNPGHYQKKKKGIMDFITKTRSANRNFLLQGQRSVMRCFGSRHILKAITNGVTLYTL